MNKNFFKKSYIYIVIFILLFNVFIKMYFGKNIIDLKNIRDFIKNLMEFLIFYKISLFFLIFFFFLIIILILKFKKIYSDFVKKQNINKHRLVYSKNRFNKNEKNDFFLKKMSPINQNVVNFFNIEMNDSYLISKRRKKYYSLLLVHFLILKLQRDELVDSLKLDKRIGNYPFTLTYDEEILSFRRSKFFDYTSTELFFLLIYGLLEWCLVFYIIHLGLCLVYDFNIFNILFSIIENFLPVHYHAYLGYIKISMLLNSIFFFFYLVYTLKEWVMELTDEVSTYQLPPKDWFVDIFLPSLQVILLFFIFCTFFFLFFYNGWLFLLILFTYPLEQLYNFTFGFFISLENLTVLLTTFNLDIFLNLYLIDKPGILSKFYGPFFSQNSILYQNIYNKEFLFNFHIESFSSILSNNINEQFINNLFLNSIEYQTMLELKIWKTELLFDIRKYNYFLKQEEEIIFYKNLINKGFRGLGLRLDNQYFINDITFLNSNNMRHFRPNSEYLIDPLITHKFFNKSINDFHYTNFSIYPDEKYLTSSVINNSSNNNNNFNHILSLHNKNNCLKFNNSNFFIFEKLFSKIKFLKNLIFFNYLEFSNNDIYVDVDFLNKLNFHINSRYIYNDVNFENLNINFYKHLNNFQISDNITKQNNFLINLNFLPQVLETHEQELIKLNKEFLNLDTNLKFKNITQFKKYIHNILILGNNLEKLNSEIEIFDQNIDLAKKKKKIQQSYINLKRFLINKNDFVSLIILNINFLIEKDKKINSTIYSDEILNLTNLLNEFKEGQNSLILDFLNIEIKKDFYYPFFNFLFKPFYYKRSLDLFQIFPRIDTSNSSYYYYNSDQQDTLKYFWDAYLIIKSRLLKIYSNFPAVVNFSNRKNVLYFYNISEKVVYNKNIQNLFLENDFYKEIASKFFSSYYNMEIKIQNFAFLQNTLWNKYFHQYYNATLITEDYEFELNYYSTDEKTKLIFIPNKKKNLSRFAQTVFSLNWKILKDQWIEYPQQNYVEPYIQYTKYITDYSEYKKLELEFSQIVLDYETSQSFDGFRKSLLLEKINDLEKQKISSSFIIDRDLLRTYQLNDYMGLLLLKDYQTSLYYDKKNFLLNHYLNYIIYFKTIFLLTNFDDSFENNFINNYNLIHYTNNEIVENNNFLTFNFNYFSYNDFIYKKNNFLNFFEVPVCKTYQKKDNTFRMLDLKIEKSINFKNKLLTQQFITKNNYFRSKFKHFCYLFNQNSLLFFEKNYSFELEGLNINFFPLKNKFQEIYYDFFAQNLNIKYNKCCFTKSLLKVEFGLKNHIEENFLLSNYSKSLIEKKIDLKKNSYNKFKILVPNFKNYNIQALKYMFNYFNLLPKQEEINSIFDRINLRLFDFVNRLCFTINNNSSRENFINNYILFLNTRNFTKLKGLDPWNLYLFNKNENIYDFLITNIELLFYDLPYDELLDPTDDSLLQMGQLTYRLFPYRLNYSIRGFPIFDKDISNSDFKKIISFYLDKKNFLQFNLKKINDKLQNTLIDYLNENYKEKFFTEFINDIAYSVGETEDPIGIPKIIKTNQQIFSSPNSRHYFIKSDIFKQIFFEYKINPYSFQMYNFPFDNQYSNVWNQSLHHLFLSNQIFNKFNSERIFGKELINNQFRYKRIYFLKTILNYYPYEYIDNQNDSIGDQDYIEYFLKKKIHFEYLFDKEPIKRYESIISRLLFFDLFSKLTPKFKSFNNTFDDTKYLNVLLKDLNLNIEKTIYENIFFYDEFQTVFFIRSFLSFGDSIFDDIGVPFYDWFINDEWVSKRFRKYGFRIFKTYRTFYNRDNRFGLIDFLPRKKLRMLQNFLMLEKPQTKKRKILKRQFVYNEHKLLIYKFIPGIRSKLPPFDNLIYRWVFVNNKIKPIPTILIFKNNQIRAAKIKNHLIFFQLLTNPINSDFGKLFWNYFITYKENFLIFENLTGSFLIDWDNNFWHEDSGKIYSLKHFSSDYIYFHENNESFAGYNRFLLIKNFRFKGNFKTRINDDFFLSRLNYLLKIFTNKNNFNMNSYCYDDEYFSERKLMQTKYFSRYLILNSQLNHLNFFTPKEYEKFQNLKWENWLNLNKFRKIEDHYIQYNLSKDKSFLYTISDGEENNIKEIEEFERLDNQFLPTDSARTHVREKEEDELPFELSNPKKYYIPYNHHSWFYNNLDSSYPVSKNKLHFYAWYGEDFDLIRKQTLLVLKRKIEFDFFQIQKIYQINDLLYRYKFSINDLNKIHIVDYVPKNTDITVFFYYFKSIIYLFYYQFLNIKGAFFIKNNLIISYLLLKISYIPYFGNLIVILYNFFFSICFFCFNFFIYFIFPFFINFFQLTLNDFYNFYRIIIKLYFHPFWLFFTYFFWILYYFIVVRFFSNSKEEYNFKNIFAQFDWDEEEYNFNLGRRKFDTKSSFEFMKSNHRIMLKNMTEFLEHDKNPTIEEIRKLNAFSYDEEIFRKNYFSNINYKNFWFVKKFPNYELNKNDAFSENTNRQTDKFIYNYFIKPVFKFFSNQGYVGKANFIFNNNLNIQKLKLKYYIDLLNKDVNRHARDTSEYGRFKWIFVASIFYLQFLFVLFISAFIFFLFF